MEDAPRAAAPGSAVRRRSASNAAGCGSGRPPPSSPPLPACLPCRGDELSSLLPLQARQSLRHDLQELEEMFSSVQAQARCRSRPRLCC